MANKIYYSMGLLGIVNMRRNKNDHHGLTFTSESSFSSHYNEISNKKGLTRLWYQNFDNYYTIEVKKDKAEQLLKEKQNYYFKDLVSLDTYQKKYNEEEKIKYTNQMKTYKGLLLLAREKSICEEYTDWNYVNALDKKIKELKDKV